jgi:hypothetical protein
MSKKTKANTNTAYSITERREDDNSKEDSVIDERWEERDRWERRERDLKETKTNENDKGSNNNKSNSSHLISVSLSDESMNSFSDSPSSYISRTGNYPNLFHFNQPFPLPLFPQLSSLSHYLSPSISQSHRQSPPHSHPQSPPQSHSLSLDLDLDSTSHSNSPSSLSKSSSDISDNSNSINNIESALGQKSFKSVNDINSVPSTLPNIALIDNTGTSASVYLSLLPHSLSSTKHSSTSSSYSNSNNNDHSNNNSNSNNKDVQIDLQDNTNVFLLVQEILAINKHGRKVILRIAPDMNHPSYPYSLQPLAFISLWKKIHSALFPSSNSSSKSSSNNGSSINFYAFSADGNNTSLDPTTIANNQKLVRSMTSLLWAPRVGTYFLPFFSLFLPCSLKLCLTCST